MIAVRCLEKRNVLRLDLKESRERTGVFETGTGRSFLVQGTGIKDRKGLRLGLGGQHIIPSYHSQLLQFKQNFATGDITEPQMLENTV